MDATSALTEYEVLLSRLRLQRESKFDTLLGFNAVHLSLLESSQSEEPLLGALREYVGERGAYRRSEVFCQQRLEASLDLKHRADENLAHQQQQQVERGAGLGASGPGGPLINLTGGLASVREPTTRVLSAEMLASRVAAYGALETKRNVLDDASRKYAELLASLQQECNSKMLMRPEVLMSSDVQAPLSVADLTSFVEVQLLRRLSGQLHDSLSSYAAIEKGLRPFSQKQGANGHDGADMRRKKKMRTGER
jgi:hypothetical protein